MFESMVLFGARELSYSRKVRKFERIFTRHERWQKFASQNRICRFCGIVTDSSDATTAHEQSSRHAVDRVERARQRMNAEVAEKRRAAGAA